MVIQKAMKNHLLNLLFLLESLDEDSMQDLQQDGVELSEEAEVKALHLQKQATTIMDKDLHPWTMLEMKFSRCTTTMTVYLKYGSS